jgi:hypothetical protein
MVTITLPPLALCFERLESGDYALRDIQVSLPPSPKPAGWEHVLGVLAHEARPFVSGRWVAQQLGVEPRGLSSALDDLARRIEPEGLVLVDVLNATRSRGVRGYRGGREVLRALEALRAQA